MKSAILATVAIDDRKVECRVTKNTTCKDVINMALKMVGQPEWAVRYFALFESAKSVEKMLPNKTKLHKQIRSWGANVNVSLEVRKVDYVKSKMASILKAKRKLQRLRSLIQSQETKGDQKFESYIHGNLETNDTFKGAKIYDKNIPIISDKENNLDVSCKMELLRRYLRDSVKLNLLEPRTRCDGSDKSSSSADDTDYELPDLSSVCGQNYHKSRLNTAFLSKDLTYCNKTVLQQNRNNLNDCMIYGQDDVTSFYDGESAFEDDSECSSICDFERNVYEHDIEDTFVKMEKIKSAFSKGETNARITEDTLLESFMNTFVAESSSDEGLSSVGSDFE